MENVYESKARGGWRARGRRAFSLIELLVATVVLTILMAIIFQGVSAVSRIWSQSSARTGTFAGARAGFEALTRNLTQATLKTYHTYADAQGNPVPLINPSFRPASGTVDRNKVPTQYLRASELHFVIDQASRLAAATGRTVAHAPGHGVFFQAPLGYSEESDNLGREGLLNVCGYFVEFGSDQPSVPAVLQGLLNPRYRYRLQEVLQPTEVNAIYGSTQEKDGNGLPVFAYDLDWLANLRLGMPAPPLRTLAENVVTLVLRPRLSDLDSNNNRTTLSGNYAYDSRAWEPGYSGSVAADKKALTRNQLPPVIDVVMIALDEPSAQRLADRQGANTPPLRGGAVNLDDYFSDASRLDDDIASLEQEFQQEGLVYRTFRSEISLPEARWSKE